MRDRLLKLIKHCTSCEECRDEDLADHLLDNGVIVPPCKPGDKVYILDDLVDSELCEDCEHYQLGGFGDPSECEKTITGVRRKECITIEEHTVTAKDIYFWLDFNCFGRTVFFYSKGRRKSHQGKKRIERKRRASEDQNLRGFFYADRWNDAGTKWNKTEPKWNDKGVEGCALFHP